MTRPDFPFETLLGRDRVTVYERGIGDYLTGKTIMITGAGGTVGAELARQTKRYDPARLLLLERSEAALFNVHRELTRSDREAGFILPLLADINDYHRMRLLFEEHKPNVVFHAAAHKHVAMLESHPAEAIRNNVLAARTVGELAGQFGAEVFVLISSDKAINPTSIMGASKRLAELAIQDLDKQFSKTRYLAVRFGNVIGSSGSVVAIFQEQIRQRRPVTVTDKRMQRYFMTDSEAARLVLQAGTLGGGGEIFMLEMGAPVNIYELACEMIRSHGLIPEVDIEIQITGVRQGEKLFEELGAAGDLHDRTRHPGILMSKIEQCPAEKITEALERMADMVYDNSTSSEIRLAIDSLLPDSRLQSAASMPITNDLQPA